MGWLEKSGRYFALVLLFLLWPALDAYQRGVVSGIRALLLAAAVAVYALTYGWYCLIGSRHRGVAAPATVAVLLTLLAVGLDHLTDEHSDNYYLMALVVAGFGLIARQALVALASIGIVDVIDTVLQHKGPIAQLVVLTVFVVPVVVIFGGGAMGLRYLVATVAELRRARAEIAQHAADRERARIARDLHDVLGHSLSVITLKGEVVTRMLPEGAPVADQVRDMLALSREALQQVRQVVSDYRQPTLANELTAARVALEAASIDLNVTRNVGALDRESEAVLGWVIREAATNVIRHSGARQCSITLSRDDGTLEIEVVNDGWRVPQAPAGNGLRGLEERLATVGGKLEASALATAGFRLRATLPAHPQTSPAARGVEVPR